MPKGPVVGPSQIPSKQVQLLENKVNKLRWVNDDLNKKAFEAQQRGLRLAEKLGFGTLEEAEAALATQAAEGQSQLCQYPSDELASHVQALQSELINHVNLGKTTLGALNDALEELSAWKEENAALRAELERVSAERNSDDAANPSDAIEVDYLREELATLQKQYTDLQEAKARSDEKHAEDFGRWRRFKEWLVEEELRQKEKHERAAKRRKLSPRGEDDEKENEGSLSPDRLSAGELEKKYGNIKRRLQEIGPRLGSDTPTRVRTPAPKRSKRKPSVLSSRNLNSRSIPPPPPTAIASSSKLAETPARPQNLKRDSPSSVVIPDDDVHPSSETEFESQPVAYLFPSRIDVTAVSSTIPQKRPRSPVHDEDSSETELESQAPSYLFPSQMAPELSARISDMTPKTRPTVQQAVQLFTPVSVVRPQKGLKGKGKGKGRSSSENRPPPSSSTASDPFHPPLPPAEQEDIKPVLPETPVSLGPRKAQERVVAEGRKTEPNDENAAPSTSDGKKRLNDYSAFKGRGRYGEEQRAGNQETTINALYALDPANNGGNDFQYEEVVRDKQKRKHMHAGDCECCRDYYDAVGPLPPRAQAPLWRSPDSTPSKPPRGDSFGDAGAAAAIEEHKQAISRHRQHWPRAKTPPGYWNIGFPDTQEVAAMNAEAARMHAQKRNMVAQEADRRGGRFKRR
ncbi:uncharacterized protein TRAVEDRAFT_154675 [Trametes versicolor FP-101664 SS1]|uniref:uncharacterized protein n=1 Tax=Trametes versicolor (strain FP-101664) TaxID=717944 RepID=UPI0004622D52|nr:uncharacterized protein TRAVEDRAFT_154675 [Trametes versicolor FP-101664 SS1]EIW53282.1 hypothetical protein TRAVEDRAFT_154675 [Trametes versicolor FP-101664 SS1]